jgi:hypothetical protein
MASVYSTISKFSRPFSVHPEADNLKSAGVDERGRKRGKEEAKGSQGFEVSYLLQCITVY